jgi:predicted lipoprotein with Yx(FWY)xxD motif
MYFHRNVAPLLSLVAAVGVLASASTARAEDQIQVATKEGIGSYLTDAAGKTLYIFKKDAPGKSACAGGCIAKWPVFYGGTVAPAPGVRAADFGTITREDGKKQTTYKGMPLYYFAADQQPGDTQGQGVLEVWFVAAP